MYPLLTQAVRGETRSVSKPYYDFFLHTFGLPLLLLMGIGPLVAWRRASLRALGKTFIVPSVAAVVTGVTLIALGFGSSTPGLLAYTFGAFVAASIVLSCAQNTRRRALSRIVAARARSSWRETGAATAGTSCARRFSCSRSASPGRRVPIDSRRQSTSR
jgi:cytochrome c biogenesis factor